jgi:hypothetical protein
VRELRGFIAATDPESVLTDSRIRTMAASASDRYDDVRLPDSVRLLAAEAAAFTYISGNDAANACRWLTLATRLLPASRADRYNRTRQNLGCS